MRLLDHPNVTKLIDVIVPDDLETFEELYIVMEYCHSDLSKLVKSKIKLDITQVKFILSNLLHGLKHLHNRQVVHRDFKPGNILVNKDCTTKICDFGFARSLQGVNKQSKQVLEQCQSDGIVEKLEQTQNQRRKLTRQISGHITTRWYRAPEIILLEKDYNVAVDMWALGCVAGELFQMTE